MRFCTRRRIRDVHVRLQEDWKVPGLTGAVSWEADGGRRELQLHVVELERQGELVPAGLWVPRVGVTWQRADVVTETVPHDSMKNRTFTVLIAMVRI